MAQMAQWVDAGGGTWDLDTGGYGPGPDGGVVYFYSVVEPDGDGNEDAHTFQAIEVMHTRNGDKTNANQTDERDFDTLEEAKQWCESRIGNADE